MDESENQDKFVKIDHKKKDAFKSKPSCVDDKGKNRPSLDTNDRQNSKNHEKNDGDVLHRKQRYPVEIKCRAFPLDGVKDIPVKK